jgi:hypothetical protein
MDPIARVAQLRRTPPTCTYCRAPADSEEHVLPEALGGRLTAPILCAAHNNTISRSADEPFARHYETLTFAAGVRRQRGNRQGKVGTTLRFFDPQGRLTTVKPDGRSEFGLETERDAKGVIQRASGPLRALTGIAKHHPDPSGFRLFEVAGPGVTIPVEVGICDENLPGYLKTALHFAAGFIAAPSPATLAALRSGILRERPVRVLLQLPFRAPYFDPKGAIRHEVTIYPGGEDAIATIMLFSSFCVTLALPHFGTRTALRYTQLLDGTGPQLAEVAPIPIPREPLSDREWDDLFATARTNIDRIFADRAQRDIEELAQQAARTAIGYVMRFGDPIHTFPTFFRAELERIPLERDLVDDLVRQAQAHIAQGRDPFDITPMLLP